MKQIMYLSFVIFNICLFNAQSTFQSSQQSKKFVMMISPDNTNEEIKNKIDFFKAELDVDVKVENIKRDDNKITALNFSFKDKKGNQGQSNLVGAQPIKGLQFSYEIDQEGLVNTSLTTNKTTPLINKSNMASMKRKYSNDEDFIKFFDKDSLHQPLNKSFSRSAKIIIDKDGNVRKSITENGEPVEELSEGEDIFNFSGSNQLNDMMEKLQNQSFSFNFGELSKDMPSLKEMSEQLKKLQVEMEDMRKELNSQKESNKKKK
jgi:hypothetical protein